MRPVVNDVPTKILHFLYKKKVLFVNKVFFVKIIENKMSQESHDDTFVDYAMSRTTYKSCIWEGQPQWYIDEQKSIIQWSVNLLSHCNQNQVLLCYKESNNCCFTLETPADEVSPSLFLGKYSWSCWIIPACDSHASSLIPWEVYEEMNSVLFNVSVNPDFDKCTVSPWM